jgi:AcrR family transcriptional regulator
LQTPSHEAEDEFRYDPELAGKLLEPTEHERNRPRKIGRILSVAVLLLATEGASGFSMRRVAAKARVSLSTLQHYFQNHDRLLSLAIDSLLGQYISEYTKISRDSKLTPEQKLDMILDDLFRMTDNQIVRKFYVNLWALTATNKNVHELVRESISGYLQLLNQIVTSMRPDLPRARVSWMVTALAAQVEGLLVLRVIEPKTMPSWPLMTKHCTSMWLKIIKDE